ncbi:MAG TPA: PIG-L family deacetylase, partial [Vulgatibacter sp.]
MRTRGAALGSAALLALAPARTRCAAIALVAALLALAPVSSRALEPDMHPGELAHALDRLASTGRVLYVAAHPDDENTRLLAWLANRRHVRAAYLSMTRGGGGQNLIGTEQGELLDAIRTEELLAARRLDGAEQRFTLARDFGYSKSADEALAIWGKEAALGDVVRVIRSFQPDVIVTRFDEVPPNHGHHIASAILAREAFAAAADPSRFPEQGLAPWQALRLVHNFTPWRGEPPAGSLSVDVGGFDPRLGLGYAELAALSRSQHKSQGFGVAGERGRLLEHFVPVAGTAAGKDLLEGVAVTWAARFGEAGAAVDRAFDAARGALDRDRPERALPHLLRAREALASLPPSVRRADAEAGVEEMIAAAAGIYVRATAPAPSANPGAEVAIELEIVPRLSVQSEITNIRFPGEVVRALAAGAQTKEPFWREAPAERAAMVASGAAPSEASVSEPVLSPGEKKLVRRTVRIPKDAGISMLHWLEGEPTAGRFAAPDPAIAADPRGPAALYVDVEL